MRGTVPSRRLAEGISHRRLALEARIQLGQTPTEDAADTHQRAAPIADPIARPTFG